MTDRELMQQALDYLESEVPFYECEGNDPPTGLTECMEALRARLAQPEQEPVAWMHDSHVGFNVPLYTAPPQREWQGLTDEEIEQIDGVEMRYIGSGDYTIEGEYEFARAIEAKLKEKNT